MSKHWRLRGHHHVLLLGLAGVAVMFASSSGLAGPQSGNVAADDKQLEDKWIDLEKGEVEASRALLGLYDHAPRAVPFLKDKMKPLSISAEDVNELILKLNSTDERVWRPAFADLEYFDPRLAVELPVLMHQVTEPLARQRLIEVLSARPADSLKGKEIALRGGAEGFHFDALGFSTWWVADSVSQINRAPWGLDKKSWTRAERTIILLERIGTSEAIAILKNMATGHPESAPTKIAKESLERAPSSPKQLEALWTDLEKPEVEGSRALLELYCRASDAVPFLKNKMKPLKINSVQVKALLLKLNSADEQLWKPAFAELEYFDPRLAIALPDLMEHVTEYPGRERLVEVLCGKAAGSLEGRDFVLRPVRDGFNFSGKNGAWWAEHRIGRINFDRHVAPKPKWTRAERAIVLLEHIRTPAAISILKAMATGHPEAQPTLVAVEALQRIDH
jgi:hypothetical protein